MIAVRDGDVVRISADAVKALAGFSGGYALTLVARPGIVFQVDADTLTLAERAALAASGHKRDTCGGIQSRAR